MMHLMHGWVWAAVTVGLMAGGGLAGWRLAADRCEARVAALEAEHASEREEAMRQAAAKLSASQEAERRALHELHATKNRLAAANKRLKEALHALPTAAECGLSGPARGLLNAAIAAPGGLPAATGGPARADAESSADPGATEADIAGWAADAIALYGECRARIDAIRQWDEVTHGR